MTPDLVAIRSKASAEELKAWPSSAKIFFKPDGAAYEPGDTLRAGRPGEIAAADRRGRAGRLLQGRDRAADRGARWSGTAG